MLSLQKLGKVFSQPLNNRAMDRATDALYRSCILQTRHEQFYSVWQVPDTVDGRFDLLLLHVIMVMRRLGTQSELRQRLFDLMFADMDCNLRELGVGDMSIGKKIKPMLAAFFGRFQAYDNAINAGGDALKAPLQKNIYNNAAIEDATLSAMTAYIHAVVEKLGQTGDAALNAGQVVFPPPAL